MGNGIRTIHDAIDTKIMRTLREIQSAKTARSEQIKQEVYGKLGVTPLLKQLEKITGRNYRNDYKFCEDDSPLGIALKTAYKELGKFDDKENKIHRIAEDAHIQVVVGDKMDVLTKLEESLSKISK